MVLIWYKGDIILKEQLETLQQLALKEIGNANSSNDISLIKVKYLGKKGELTNILKQMGKLSKDERPIMGALANSVREYVENSLDKKLQQLKISELQNKLLEEKIDVTIDKDTYNLGNLHPLNIVLNEIQDIFKSLGFTIENGPEVEFSSYNFDSLNIPKNHPARDIKDTFYIDDDVVLRTQTSPVQIRVMKNKKPPIKVISPGKVYRPDDVDATHSPMFHQIEGLVIDKGITMSDLKGTLLMFCKKLYGDNVKLRFRPHHFPFTEPSAEVDISCFSCNGTGCKLCKNEGYIEILGCGMVHKNVLTNCGIDPNEYSGFAFGLGLERIVMKKFNIDDLRLFTENDIRFLKQF